MYRCIYIYIYIHIYMACRLWTASELCPSMLPQGQWGDDEGGSNRLSS